MGSSRHSHAHPIADDRAATVEEVAEVVANLPSLEQIQSTRRTARLLLQHWWRMQFVLFFHFKAKVEPLVQIQLAPGSNKVVELPKPAEFQPRKTKVPFRKGEQRLIIATCEKARSKISAR